MHATTRTASVAILVALGLTLTAGAAKPPKPEPEKGNDPAGAANPVPAPAVELLPVPGFVPPAAGEHPRLFFRKADLPEIKRRAETPEGKAIVARLRYTLNAGDGRSLPQKPADVATPGVGQAYTLWHAAGYGMLYHLTGDQLYADLGRTCTEMALKGTPDRDSRYKLGNVSGALRNGPALGALAMGYDLCYDGWAPAFREQVAQKISTHTTPRAGNIEQLARGAAHGPRSNHWGPQIGGASLALLAVRNDSGVDTARVDQLLELAKASYIRQLSEGLGTRGYFWEGPGPGQITTDTAFVPGLQAWRVAGGLDFAAAREEAQWCTLRWVMWLLPTPDGPEYPQLGRYSSYGGQRFSREGLSRGGQFAQGFGAVLPEQKAALLWTYRNALQPTESTEYGAFAGLQAGKCSYDTVSPYPHRAVLALVNWPIDVEAVNPGTVLPKVVVDERLQYYVFRNRWQGGDDVIVSVALGARPDPGMRIRIWGRGQRYYALLPHQPDGGKLTQDGPDAWTLTWATGSIAVDFSGKHGAEAVVRVSGIEVYADPPESVGPAVEKLDLTGDWSLSDVPPHKVQVQLKQVGDKIESHGVAPWRFAGTLAGQTLSGFFNDAGGGTATVSADGNRVLWTNGIWVRMGSPAAEPQKGAYRPGDKAKLVSDGHKAVVTFTTDGKHPDLKP